MQISLTGAKDKIAQISSTLHRRTTATELGIPGFASPAGRATATKDPS